MAESVYGRWGGGEYVKYDAHIAHTSSPRQGEGRKKMILLSLSLSLYTSLISGSQDTVEDYCIHNPALQF